MHCQVLIPEPTRQVEAKGNKKRGTSMASKEKTGSTTMVYCMEQRAEGCSVWMFVPVLIISVKYDPEGNILFAPEIYNTMEEHVNISIVAGTNFHSITQRTFFQVFKEHN